MNNAPKTTDHIAIIGAGPSGIHLAHLLHSRGFSRVTVFERTDRVGGKSLTRVVDGIPHEMGTCYLHPGYQRLQALVGELGLAPVVKPGGREGDRDMYASWVDGAQPLGPWMLATLERAFFPGWARIAPDVFQAPRLLAAIRRYGKIHRSLLGDLSDVSMPAEPSEAALAELDCTFGEFLQRNDLRALIPLFLLSHSAQGYGLLETIPALYGLWWNTPEVLNSFREASSNPDAPVLMMLQDGYQQIWETLVAKHEMAIEFGVAVSSVARPESGPIVIHGTQNGTVQRWEADHLVLACNLPRAMGFVEPTETERTLFEAMHTAQLTTTLVRAPSLPDAECIAYWPEVLRPGRPGRVYCRRSSRVSVRTQRPREVMEDYVFYQYDDHHRPGREATLQRQLLADLAAMGMTEVEVLEQHVWPYFTRFTADAIQRRYPWRLQRAQGHARTWYVGGSACFESIHDILSYNHDLMDRMLVAQRTTGATAR